MTKAKQAHLLKQSGLTWREVATEMGISPRAARVAEYGWRKRKQRAAYFRTRDQRTKDQRRTQQRVYRLANAKSLAEKQRAYSKARRKETAERARLWREANSEKIRAYSRRYHEENRSELLMRRSIWEFGPELGPLHRAICDLRAAARTKEE